MIKTTTKLKIKVNLKGWMKYPMIASSLWNYLSLLTQAYDIGLLSEESDKDSLVFISREYKIKCLGDIYLVDSVDTEFVQRYDVLGDEACLWTNDLDQIIDMYDDLSVDDISFEVKGLERETLKGLAWEKVHVPINMPIQVA